MTLRSDLIEAMAEVVYSQRFGPSMCGSRPGSIDVHIAAATLDALIAYLTERADAQTITHTDRLGQLSRPRTVAELLEALSAPINPEGGEQ